MPRLYHRKSMTGCVRCKQRRVKCDEQHPTCSACQRHQVVCQYRNQNTQPAEANGHRQDQNRLAVPVSDAVLPPAPLNLEVEPPNDSNKKTLEHALLHYFLTETMTTFHDPSAVWRTRMPLVGLKYRFVLDALLSLAALDLYRHTDEADVTHRESTGPRPSQSISDCHLNWRATRQGRQHYLVGHTPEDMQHLSRVYFESALKGQQEALMRSDEEYFEPAFMASLAIMTNALWSLACPTDSHESQETPRIEETLWFSLGRGCREVVISWNRAMNMDVLDLAGYFEMKPDMRDEVELFAAEHQHVFGFLLVWGSEFEHIVPEEQEAYEKAVNYLGRMYKGLRSRSEPAKVTGSFIAGFAAKMDDPFCQLIMEGRPRALAVVGHLFGIMRLIEAEVQHYKGIADRRIPAICERLPEAWKRAMKWPLSIVARPADTLETPDSPPSLEELQLDRKAVSEGV